MVKFNKSKNYKFWHSPIVLIVLFIAVVFFSYNIVDLVKKSKETNEKKSLILREIKYLQTKADSLNKDITILDTDLGKEEELREKLPYTKVGEKSIIILESKEINEEKIIEEKINNWDRFWLIFKK